MPPGSPPRPRRTRRSVPWLLATLTLTLALAGPAYADTLGTEGIPDPETVLASEVPELSEVPVEVPSEAIEPLTEPAEAPPAEPPVPVPESPPPLEDPPVAEPAEEAVSLGPAAEPAEPVVDTGVSEEPAGEPPAYTADEPEPPLTQETGNEESEPPLVVPLNLNVDIRILSPGDDGDVSQVIDVGGPQGLGSGTPADMLGGLGMDDLGLDWSWNWNWTWDCGGTSTAGLDWNWNWSWSGDCAGGLFDEQGVGSMPSLGEQLRGDPSADFLDALDSDVIGLPLELGGDGPAVASPGAGRSAPAHRGERDEAGSPGAPAFPSGDGGFPASSLASTTFASIGATTRPEAATAPARSPAGTAPNGDPERQPAGLPAHAMGLAAAAGGGGGGAAFTVLLLAALVGALALLPPPPGERVRAVQKKLSSLLSSSRLERPG